MCSKPKQGRWPFRKPPSLTDGRRFLGLHWDAPSFAIVAKQSRDKTGTGGASPVFHGRPRPGPICWHTTIPSPLRDKRTMKLSTFSRFFANLGLGRSERKPQRRQAPARHQADPGVSRRPDPAVHHAGGRRDQPEHQPVLRRHGLRPHDRIRPANRDGPDQQPEPGRGQRQHEQRRQRQPHRQLLHGRRTVLDGVHIRQRRQQWCRHGFSRHGVRPDDVLPGGRVHVRRQPERRLRPQ